MTTSLEELQTLVAQSILSTEAFKEQVAASQEAADRRAEALDRQIKELSKQIGGLGNKFGYFTEGLLLPSVQTILRKTFGITEFQTRVQAQNDGELQELDGFGFVNGEKNIGFIVEVKSLLDKRGIEQTVRQLERFPMFHSQYKGMTLFGIIAAVDTVSKAQRDAVFEAGLYLVTVNDDVAELAPTPLDFTPLSARVA